MGTWTNAGLTLIATAVQTAGANAAISYVAIGTGCGTLASPITASVAVTSLALNAGLPAALAGGASLTVTDGTNTETVTVGGGGATQGATAITINSWTPAHSYVANTTGVAPTPLATDLALYNEVARVAANAGVAGANPGESLTSGYFDGTQATNLYMQVGYFGGSTASSTLGSGTMIGADVQYWSHTLNADSNMFQADTTI